MSWSAEVRSLPRTGALSAAEAEISSEGGTGHLQWWEHAVVSLEAFGHFSQTSWAPALPGWAANMNRGACPSQAPGQAGN